MQAGRLPPRYGIPIEAGFLAALEEALVPGVQVLDAGSGRHPALAPEHRPAGCHYVGLDISGEELAAANAGAYDDVIVADLSGPLGLREEFDIVVSWQVLEHVAPLDVALESLRTALRPGGTLVAQLSGTYAAFALAARAMPHRLRVLAMKHLLGHSADEKFPTTYDRCHSRALRSLLEPWASARVEPLWRGAIYFEFARPLQRAYLAYESLVERHGIDDLGTHYLIVARKGM